MNVVDSSGWIEFLTAGPNGPAFKAVIQDTATLIVPVIVIFEVFKYVFRTDGEKEAHILTVAMQQGRVVDIDTSLVLSAARLSRDHGLAMADSLIYAVARSCGATLWTQDVDFQNLPGVRYLAKGAS